MVDRVVYQHHHWGVTWLRRTHVAELHCGSIRWQHKYAVSVCPLLLDTLYILRRTLRRNRTARHHSPGCSALPRCSWHRTETAVLCMDSVRYRLDCNYPHSGTFLGGRQPPERAWFTESNSIQCNFYLQFIVIKSISERYFPQRLSYIFHFEFATSAFSTHFNIHR